MSQGPSPDIKRRVKIRVNHPVFSCFMLSNIPSSLLDALPLEAHQAATKKPNIVPMKMPNKK